MQKKTINELEEKLRQKELDNENKLINDIKELKEYKEKYEELLKEKKDDEEIFSNIPPLETEEEAAENIADINERRNDTRKKEESNFNENGIDVNGLDRDGYNINGIDLNGLYSNGLNINGTKGTRKRYPRKNPNYKEDDNGVLYDKYGFDSTGLNENGFDIYGFDSTGLNKDGYDIDDSIKMDLIKMN